MTALEREVIEIAEATADALHGIGENLQSLGSRPPELDVAIQKLRQVSYRILTVNSVAPLNGLSDADKAEGLAYVTERPD